MSEGLPPETPSETDIRTAADAKILAIMLDDVRTSLREGDWPEAMRQWRAARPEAVGEEAVCIDLAAALRGRGWVEEAEQVLGEAAKRFPHDLDAAVRDAQAADARGDHSESARRWQMVRSRFPDSPRGYVG